MKRISIEICDIRIFIAEADTTFKTIKNSSLKNENYYHEHKVNQS